MNTSAQMPIAAIDLGSNSFHMIVADANGDDFRVVDRMREVVRLAAGLDADNNLTANAIGRALTCLELFGERVRDIPQGSVRVVGTNTLRKARNAWSFITRAETALGHPIDIISGHEEARLIYLGVAHGLDDAAEQRLVIDIGGGSTEFILGRRFEPSHTESVHLGCVGHTAAYFADGNVSAKAMRAAEIAARQELETFEFSYLKLGWQSAIGASGTMLAVREILLQQGWSEEGITRTGLERLSTAMLRAGHINNLDLKGLSDERRPVLPGGVAILKAAFAGLRIERMRVSDRALREGLLYDLLGRIHQEDVRERTIKELARRYHIDTAQCERVEATALNLLSQVPQAWSLASDEDRRLLQWAATLHEIGLSVSHSQYQKHGAYLLTHLDMAGFGRAEQNRLAALVRGHRRKLPSAEFSRLPAETAEMALRLCVLLRLAIVLHRSRSEEPLPRIALACEGHSVKITFPERWLSNHPLSRADFESEAGYLKSAGFKLNFK